MKKFDFSGDDPKFDFSRDYPQFVNKKVFRICFLFVVFAIGLVAANEYVQTGSISMRNFYYECTDENGCINPFYLCDSQSDNINQLMACNPEGFKACELVPCDRVSFEYGETFGYKNEAVGRAWIAIILWIPASLAISRLLYYLRFKK